MAQGAKLVVAIDIDEVLMPHFQDLIKYYNRLYGTHLTLSDNHPKDTKNWGTSDRNEAITRVQKFFSTDEFKKSQPFEEAKQAVKMLAERYKLVVITSRDTIIEESTRQWLNEHFVELFDEVHFTSMYSLDGSKSGSKAQIGKELNIDYLIDDSFDHIQEASENNIKGLLFGDYPWNKDVTLPENVQRVKDWKEVLEILL